MSAKLSCVCQQRHRETHTPSCLIPITLKFTFRRLSRPMVGAIVRMYSSVRVCVSHISNGQCQTYLCLLRDFRVGSIARPQRPVRCVSHWINPLIILFKVDVHSRSHFYNMFCLSSTYRNVPSASLPSALIVAHSVVLSVLLWWICVAAAGDVYREDARWKKIKIQIKRCNKQQQQQHRQHRGYATAASTKLNLFVSINLIG